MGISNQQSAIKPGTVAYFAAASAPAGWVKANGAAVSRAIYAALFLEIGTIYGVGDGATTFNLPDLRGEFMRGFDDGRGIDSGRAIGTAQAGAIEAHAHNVTTRQFGVSGSDAPGLTDTSYGQVQKATSSTGGTETRPRNVALLACIKY